MVDLSKDGKDPITLPCNGLVTHCVTDKNISFPFPCQLLKDPSDTNDDKVLVRLAYPYENVKLRPFKKNVKYYDTKTHRDDLNDVCEAEIDHLKEYGNLGYQTILPQNGKWVCQVPNNLKKMGINC